MKLIFLVADKRQRLLQIGSIIVGVWPCMPKLPKMTSLIFQERSE